ncbi:MAG: hypothetical protein AB1441_03690 [Bacillota bacterium]
MKTIDGIIIAVSTVARRNKRAREKQPERLVKLTVVAEEDIEPMAEFGIIVLQRGPGMAGPRHPENQAH